MTPVTTQDLRNGATTTLWSTIETNDEESEAFSSTILIIPRKTIASNSSNHVPNRLFHRISH